MSDLRTQAIGSVETAIAHLAEALDHLDRLPPSSTPRVGLVAHAMNNYLSVADAVLDLLDGALANHPDREVTSWIEGLRHLGALMAHAVGRLFETTSPTDLPLEFEPIDLARLMKRTCDFHRSRAQRKRQAIVCRPGAAIPAAWGDRVAAAVVADSLLSNAVKFSRLGGVIDVEVQPGPGGVACRVCDDGPGLTPAEEARLFQPGVHVGPAPTAGETSHGYGLAFARDLIERMGGRLWVDTAAGHGACFSFRLPYPPGDASGGLAGT